ncbi:hypothetical protein GCM10023085_29910 [Actinomadura viridis]|uniref:Glycosyltransferase RgtA/B/C/D-like domain-containing protein n=1 Tax=Actinomadura viridis TaxID=58110 RepID=A0A931GGT2_9ACTN|nr:hypothetical protein [Actinomadura viridis]MBG6086675.1 hypothetical protein [Actinomadura viridis]
MRAGRLLARISTAPALLIVAWLAVSLPLLLAGVFRPGPALVLFVPAAALVLWLGLRERRPPHDENDGNDGDGDGDGGEAGERAGPLGAVSWWSAGGVLAVGLGFLVFQVVMCAEQVIVRRDPASYVQFATWLIDHGSLPIPQWRAAFGGDDAALRYGSPAFYQVGQDLVPQFMAGLPLVLAFGGWLGGTHGLLAMAPLLGACAVVAFGGLVARLVGPRWAPAGALLLALTTPMVWVSRSTYSELPALVLLLGGLALLHDARKEEERRAAGGGRRRGLPPETGKAFLGGLALGLIVLVRIDGLRDVLPVVVFAGLLVAGRRHRTGLPLAAGLAVGAGAGLAEGFLLSRPYLDYLSASLDPLLAISAALVAATAAMTIVLRWEVTGSRLRRLGAAVSQGRTPAALAVLTALLFTAFAARPLVQTVRREPANTDDELNVHFIEQVQRIGGLAVDGTRQYSELSLHWVAWYIGVPGLLMAALGAALLARRLARGRAPEWTLPFAMIAWTTVLVLWRPGITPDHPWASRRLIAVVVPGLLLLAVWGTAWTTRRIRRSGYGPRIAGRFAAGAALLLLVPIVVSSGGILASRTDQGEVAAVRRLCGQLGPGRSAVVVERATADRFLQVIRSMCGVPAARTVTGATQADVRRVIGKVYEAGRRPVIVGAEAGQVAPYGRPVHAVSLRTRQDERTLVEPPDGTWSLSVDVWTTEPPPPPDE